MPNVLPASLHRTLATPRAARVALSLLCGAASRASKAASVCKTRDAAALKGIRKIAINSFQIDFVTRRSATAQTVGVAITDQLFAQFTASLAQPGYEVLSRLVAGR